MSFTVTHKFVSPKTEQTDSTIVGPNEWNAIHTVVDNGARVVMTDYNFASQAPGGNLIIGSNTITLNPIPDGIAIGGSLLLSGGSGASEIVPITGFNSTSGQIIVTCVNSHSGAWTVGSATNGLQEAINYLSSVFSGGTVVVPAGTWTLQATVHVKNFISIVGLGMYVSILQRTGDYGDTIVAGASNVGVDNIFLQDLMIQQYINYQPGTPGTAINLPTNGAHLKLMGCNQGTCNRVRFENGFKNVSIIGGASIRFYDCVSYGMYDARSGSPKATNTHLDTFYDATLGIPTFIRLYRCDFQGQNNGTSNSSSNYSGIAGLVGVSLYGVEDFEMVGGSIGGMCTYGFQTSAQPTSTIIGNVRVLGVKFDSSAISDAICTNISSSNTVAFGVIFANCVFNGELCGQSGLTIGDVGSGNASANGVLVIGNVFFAYGYSPILIGGGVGHKITGNIIYGYNIFQSIASSQASGIAILGRCSKYIIDENHIGGDLAFGDYGGTNHCLFGITVADFLGTNKGTIINNSTPNGISSIGTPSDLVFLNTNTPVIFANIPPTPPIGTIVTITDSSTNTWGATVTGGGSNNVSARWNGSNWTVVGK